METSTPWPIPAFSPTVTISRPNPVNVWMVDKGLKHGMGTQRGLGKGGHSIEAEHARWAEPELAGEGA